MLNKFLEVITKVLTIKYLKIAILNTIFSYVVATYLFIKFFENLGMFSILIIINIITISFSFLLYKFLFFKTKKYYFLEEMKRMYLVYLSTFFFSYFIIHYLFNKLEMSIYLVIVITQGLTTLINIFSQFFYIFRVNIKKYN